MRWIWVKVIQIEFQMRLDNYRTLISKGIIKSISKQFGTIKPSLRNTEVMNIMTTILR